MYMSAICVKSLVRASCVFFVVCGLPGLGWAAPGSVDLAARVSRRGKVLTFTPSFGVGAVGECTLTLYGAPRRQQLEDRRNDAQVLIQYEGTLSGQLLRARAVPLLKRSSRGRARRRFFFSLEADCPGARVVSPVASVRIRGIRGRGRRPAKWLRALGRKIQGLSVVLREVPGDLQFSRPIDFQTAPGQTDRVYIAEQAGKIFSVTIGETNSEKTLFLDIEDEVACCGERGLLGFAFHPDFENSGFLFVHYNEGGTGDTLLERYQVQNGVVNKASATLFLRIAQPASNHNAGSIAFGLDGFLYFPLGDGGGAGDSFNNAQDLSTLLGSLLRIDVDTPEGNRNYSIPSDNPFVGNNSGFREEAWAYGFRNPFRMSIDPETGDLWLGDVGQSSFEEIDLVTRGGNYGWNTLEGNECFNPPQNCNRSGLEAPVLAYPHSQGASVIGGHVYRGNGLAGFKGAYIYGDFISGRIWSLRRSGDEVLNAELLDTDKLISCIGRDTTGELYVLDLGSGGVFRLEMR